MSEQRFQVVFSGQVAEGWSLEQTREQLESLAVLSQSEAQRAFSGTPVVLKNNLNEVQAQRYESALKTAGAVCQLAAREGDYAVIILPSGETRKIHVRCRATIGQIGNIDFHRVRWGKAGRTRHRGRRPHNRGTSMNPVAHPMGGGEGRTAGGRHPCSPWGQLAKGLKTRKNKATDKYIVRRRKKK